MKEHNGFVSDLIFVLVTPRLIEEIQIGWKWLENENNSSYSGEA